MGAGGGQPEPGSGDPRATQEGTGTGQECLGGTVWEPGTEQGPALPLCSSWKAKPRLKHKSAELCLLAA